MILDPLSAARANIGDAELAHRRHVVPLYEPGEREEAVLAGSSVLLGVPRPRPEEPATILVSATHVFDFNDDSTLFVPGVAGAFVPLGDIVVGEATKIPLPESGQRMPDDTHDFAFAEVKPSKLAGWLEAYWIAGADPDEAFRPHRLYVLHGFPRTKNKKHRPGQSIRPKMHAHIARPASFDKLDAERFDPAFHVALEYDKKNDYDIATGRSRVAPDLDKMSGGPIWGIPGDATLLGPDATLPLVGICTEQPPGTKAVVGTRIGLVIEAIRHRMEHLAPALPKARSTRINVQEKLPTDDSPAEDGT